ncbi:MAG: amidase [Pseudomonadota bacterium]
MNKGVLVAEDILTWSARAQRDAVTHKRVTVEALMEATLDRVALANDALNAVVSMREADVLLAEARALDKAGAEGPLAGLPTAIKDLHHARGMVNSEGSPIFAGHVSEHDDPHVARMRAAGAMFIGKTNVPEFGLGSHSYNPVFGVTGNPYALHLSAGGSSGGAAAALAAGMMVLADGSDMMGSLRNPAGWCNVYGMRPSHGLVPGSLSALKSGDLYLHKLSTRGPMARDPEDLALFLGVMTGSEAYEDLQPSRPGTRVAWLGNWGGALTMEPGILTLCERALAEMEGQGASVTALLPPVSRDLIWESWTDLRSFTLAAEAQDLYADKATRAQLKPEAVWEIERGLNLSAMDVHAASLKRSDWHRAAMALFEDYDLLALPSAQVWPFPVEWHWPEMIEGQMMDTYHRWMEVVVPASLLGLPSICVPAGFGENGLPMGLQLIGRPGSDRQVLEVALAYHRGTEWPQTCSGFGQY